MVQQKPLTVLLSFSNFLLILLSIGFGLVSSITEGNSSLKSVVLFHKVRQQHIIDIQLFKEYQQFLGPEFVVGSIQRLKFGEVRKSFVERRSHYLKETEKSLSNCKKNRWQERKKDHCDVVNHFVENNFGSIEVQTNSADHFSRYTVSF